MVLRGLRRGSEPEQLRWIRTLACRAYWTALEGRPGVVHLNFPLHEPLVTEEQLPEDRSGRAGGAPYVLRAPSQSSGEEHFSRLRGLVARARRGVLIAGRHERDRSLGPAAAAFAEAVGWPLLADPMSGARRGSAAIAHYDALLREDELAGSLAPDLVLRVGDLPVSKPLRRWLALRADTPQVALDPEGAWQDPAAVLAYSLPLEPGAALARLGGTLAGASGGSRPVEDDWLASWRSADELAAEAIVPALGEQQLSEPAVAAELGVLLPAEATLFVASSMPVRDIETFWPSRPDPPRVLCNRGANGIDGTVSSALGAAAGEPGPVVLLIGDVALAHDLGGLLAVRRLGLELTIVLIDNDGGSIFDFLPVAGASIGRAPAAGPAEPLAAAGRARTSTPATSPPPRASISPVPPSCTASPTRPPRRCPRSVRRSSGPSRPRRGRRSSTCAATVARTSSCTDACGRRCRSPAGESGGQPDSSGSSACSLTSVSASSPAGSESRTMPLPA